MLVDDNMASLTMGKNILKEKYDVYPISSGEKFFEILQKITPDLILLDVSMPDMDGYEVIRRLKASRKTQDIPVIFLTSRDDPGNELEGLSLGAIDYVSKPLSPALLIQRIDNQLLLDSRKKELEKYNHHLKEMAMEFSSQNSELLLSILGAMADAAESRETAISGHGKRISGYMQIMLNELGAKGIYQDETASLDVNSLIPASRLHDIGKLFISDVLLNKKSALTAGELEQINLHPVLGADFIDKISSEKKEHTLLKYAGIISLSHHEKWDGTGYPKGLKGKEIPLPGRLAALADIYDALISVRPYRSAFSVKYAQNFIIEAKGTFLDPILVDIFGDNTARFAGIVSGNQV